MISQVEIKGLYGMYDYNIQFTADNPVLVITGPNGFGKTTLLRIINNLCECNFWYFYELHFTSIKVVFQENSGSESCFELVHFSNSLNGEDFSESTITTTLDISYSQLTPSKSKKIIEEFRIEPQDYEKREREFRRRLGRFYYRDTQIIDEEAFFAQYYDLREETFLQDNARNIIMFFANKRCCFIKEQRIMSFAKEQSYEVNRFSGNHYSINEISNNIRQRYDEEQRKYAQNSHSIDSTFISRLLSQKTKTLNEQEYSIRLKKLKQQTEQLRIYNLLTDTVQLVEEYSDKYKDVLSLHLQDMEEKMNSFNVFLKELELFNLFISQNVLSNKKIILNYQGITIETASGTKVPLTKLSSGEQNLIILYYRLVFESEVGKIFLIDEPENSLHMAWLENMLRDYIKMAKSMSCQVLIATHSPAFINGYWDLTYDLYENNTYMKVQ